MLSGTAEAFLDRRSPNMKRKAEGSEIYFTSADLSLFYGSKSCRWQFSPEDELVNHTCTR